jgi:hypothetical protein
VVAAPALAACIAESTRTPTALFIVNVVPLVPPCAKKRSPRIPLTVVLLKSKVELTDITDWPKTPEYIAPLELVEDWLSSALANIPVYDEPATAELDGPTSMLVRVALAINDELIGLPVDCKLTSKLLGLEVEVDDPDPTVRTYAPLVRVSVVVADATALELVHFVKLLAPPEPIGIVPVVSGKFIVLLADKPLGEMVTA